MSQPVNGTNMMLYYHDVDTDTDIPFACARECAMTITPTFKDVTDYASAFFKKVKPDIAEWGITVNGLIILSNYSYLFMTNLQLARTSILVKFVVDNGSDGLVIYAGSVYMGSITLTGNYNSEGVYSAQLVGTGAWNSTGTQVTPGGIIVEGGSVTRFEYTVSAGGTVITISSTIGANTIIDLDRGASNITKIIFTGSPTGNEVLWKPDGTFTVAAGNEWLATEEISGSYK